MSSIRNLFTAISVVVVIFILGFFMWRSSSQSKASNTLALSPTPSLQTLQPTPTDDDEEPIPLSFEIGEFVETVSRPTDTPAPSPTPIPVVPPDQLIAKHIPHSGPGYTMGKRDMIRSNGQAYIEIDILTDGTKPIEEVIASFQAWIKTIGITPEDLKKVKVAVIKP
ncbi:MAG: hypothetical protein WCJ70_03495 [bacterium]